MHFTYQFESQAACGTRTWQQLLRRELREIEHATTSPQHTLHITAHQCTQAGTYWLLYHESAPTRPQRALNMSGCALALETHASTGSLNFIQISFRPYAIITTYSIFTGDYRRIDNIKNWGIAWPAANAHPFVKLRASGVVPICWRAASAASGSGSPDCLSMFKV